MGYISSKNHEFLRTLENWFRSRTEIMVLFRYSHSAGAKDFEFFSTFQSLVDRMQSLPARTCITAFRQPQLPARGVVDEGFISKCWTIIPEGTEFLMVETTRRIHGSASWFHHAAGESHAELRQELEN